MKVMRVNSKSIGIFGTKGCECFLGYEGAPPPTWSLLSTPWVESTTSTAPSQAARDRETS